MSRHLLRRAFKLPDWSVLPKLLNELGQRCYFPVGSTPNRLFINTPGGELCETEDNVYVITDNGDAKRIPKAGTDLESVVRDLVNGGDAWTAAVTAVDRRLRGRRHLR